MSAGPRVGVALVGISTLEALTLLLACVCVCRDEIEEEARKKEAYLRDQAEIKEQLEAAKAERLHHAFIHSHFIKEALEETDSPAWRAAIQKKNEREQRKAAFYQQLLAHRAKQKVWRRVRPCLARLICR